ncbi:hypothetical protein KR026_002523, partial [Drosophila bipectinata]
VYLGIDFWKSFNLVHSLISPKISEIKFDKDEQKENPKMHLLSPEQQGNLDKVIQRFPSFDREGLGRTHLIEYAIDVGDAKPVKQRHWPISPAVEKLMFEEVDRMLDLGIIEESKSPWSSNSVISNFCMHEIKYLGFIIGYGQLKTDTDKIRAINEFPVPTSVKQLRRFLGLTGWYRRFVDNYATISFPLTQLLRKNRPLEWNQEADKAFADLKDKLTSAPILNTPDFSRPFILLCDASIYGVGCVLAQANASGD